MFTTGILCPIIDTHPPHLCNMYDIRGCHTRIMCCIYLTSVQHSINHLARNRTTLAVIQFKHLYFTQKEKNIYFAKFHFFYITRK